MQRFVPPVFDSNSSAAGPESADSPLQQGGARWRLRLFLAVATLGLAFGAYLFTLELLDQERGSAGSAGVRSQLPALAMAVLAGAAALGLIGLAQQMTGFLAADRRPAEDVNGASEALAPDTGVPAGELAQMLRRQREETAHLLAVLESIPEGVVVQDLDGRVVLVNEAARRLLGSQRAFRAARLHELTEVIRATLGPALAPGIYALGDPTRVPFEGKLLQAQAAALLSARGVRLGTVVLIRDVTAEVERERVRADLLDQLSAQVAAPGPLRAYSSLDALAREVTRNTRSVQQVIAALQDLSTFEPRDLATDQRPLELNELVQDTAHDWQPLAEAARIRLHVRFAPRGHYVLGDERRLRWALGNVLDNAIKYSPPDTAVLIAGQVHLREPACAEIAVEDQGVGIAPVDLPHVFTRFYRGEPRDAHGNALRCPGTGQGLYIAQRVIKAHGGTLAIASQLQRGTTVTIELPLTAPVTLELPDAEETVRRPGIVDLVDLDDTPGIPVIALLPIEREVDLL